MQGRAREREEAGLFGFGLFGIFFLCPTAIAETQQKNPGQLSHTHTLAHGSCFPRGTTSTFNGGRFSPPTPRRSSSPPGREGKKTSHRPCLRSEPGSYACVDQSQPCRATPFLLLSFFLSFLLSFLPPRPPAPSSQGRGRLQSGGGGGGNRHRAAAAAPPAV